MSYLEVLLHPRTARQVRADARRMIKTAGLRPTAIAVSGNSGVLIGAPLALLINTPIIIVRKQGVESHGNEIEFPDVLNRRTLFARVLIVDDGIATGETVKYIVSELTKYTNQVSSWPKINFIGILTGKQSWVKSYNELILQDTLKHKELDMPLYDAENSVKITTTSITKIRKHDNGKTKRKLLSKSRRKR